MPVTNAPPRPSTVNAPATCSGSPVATYAAISASVTSAKCTTVEAVAAATRPVAVSRRQWPVWSTPERPRIACQRRTASSASRGLAERLAVELEHRVAAEHQRAVGDLVAAATAAHLSSASRSASSAGGRPVTSGLVDAGDDHRRVEAGRAEGGQPGGGGRGEDEGGHSMNSESREPRSRCIAPLTVELVVSGPGVNKSGLVIGCSNCSGGL